MRRTLAPVLLLLPLLALLVWDLWAVLLDRRFRGTDTFVEQAIHCAESMEALYGSREISPCWMYW